MYDEAYPVELTVETDEGIFNYENDSPTFKTEDTFNNTTFMRIYPRKMKNGIGIIKALSRPLPWKEVHGAINL